MLIWVQVCFSGVVCGLRLVFVVVVKMVGGGVMEALVIFVLYFQKTPILSGRFVSAEVEDRKSCCSL